MECRDRYRDDYRLPSLSLGLTSVRLIVNQLEAEYARAANNVQDTSTELVKYNPNIDEAYDDYNDSPLEHPRGRVCYRIAINLWIALSKCIPSVSFGNFGALAVATGLVAPRMISYLVLYPFCRLVFGTLYPAYASYKAVRTKNLKEYVKWMMYWIVFALFTCTETFTDVFLSWFPFYYEVKIVLVLWLLSPATKGSSILYRKFVHPALCRREQEIDEYIAKAKDQGYHTVLNLGTKGVNYATTVIMQTAIKGGGGLVQQLRKSYSLSDLTECDPREERAADEADDVLGEPRLLRRQVKSGPRRSASESNSRSPMYFPEVDVDVRTTRSSRVDEPDLSHIKSSEDISSGYSSADNSASLTRAGSLGARARVRSVRTTVTSIKRPQAAEDDEVIDEEPRDDDTFEFANMPPLVNVPSPLFLSHSDPPFLYQYIGDQIKIIQVLGDLPLSLNSNKTPTNTDQWDQIEATSKTTIQRESIEKENIKIDNVQKETKHDVEIIEATVLQTENTKEDNNSSSKTDKIIHEIIGSATETNKDIDLFENKHSVVDDSTKTQQEIKVRDEKDVDELKTSESVGEINKSISVEAAKSPETPVKIEESVETTSLEMSINENDSAESDDEASFGTPDDSPKSKRKAKGKYGKAKAPPPPPVKIEHHDVTKEHDNKVLDSTISTTSQESLTDLVNRLPDSALKESGISKGLQIVNPIAEKKRRHKAKSPARIPKGQNSSIGKLLQLPSKLAFWQKSDDKVKSDTVSNSSEDHSRRSSTVERANDEFQSCSDLNKIIIKDDLIEDDRLSFKDAADFDSEAISQDIIDKSDALQKLIEAKLETHPEYKFVPLHEDIPTTSKSTDV